jgi:hypothetical protein
VSAVTLATRQRWETHETHCASERGRCLGPCLLGLGDPHGRPPFQHPVGGARHLLPRPSRGPDPAVANLKRGIEMAASSLDERAFQQRKDDGRST